MKTRVTSTVETFETLDSNIKAASDAVEALAEKYKEKYKAEFRQLTWGSSMSLLREIRYKNDLSDVSELPDAFKQEYEEARQNYFFHCCKKQMAKIQQWHLASDESPIKCLPDFIASTLNYLNLDHCPISFSEASERLEAIAMMPSPDIQLDEQGMKNAWHAGERNKIDRLMLSLLRASQADQLLQTVPRGDEVVKQVNKLFDLSSDNDDVRATVIALLQATDENALEECLRPYSGRLYNISGMLFSKNREIKEAMTALATSLQQAVIQERSLNG